VELGTRAKNTNSWARGQSTKLGLPPMGWVLKKTGWLLIGVTQRARSGRKTRQKKTTGDTDSSPVAGNSFKWWKQKRGEGGREGVQPRRGHWSRKKEKQGKLCEGQGTREGLQGGGTSPIKGDTPSGKRGENHCVA